jgi:hypothetical protein
MKVRGRDTDSIVPPARTDLKTILPRYKKEKKKERKIRQTDQ